MNTSSYRSIGWLNCANKDEIALTPVRKGENLAQLVIVSREEFNKVRGNNKKMIELAIKNM